MWLAGIFPFRYRSQRFPCCGLRHNGKLCPTGSQSNTADAQWTCAHIAPYGSAESHRSCQLIPQLPESRGGLFAFSSFTLSRRSLSSTCFQPLEGKIARKRTCAAKPHEFCLGKRMLTVCFDAVPIQERTQVLSNFVATYGKHRWRKSSKSVALRTVAVSSRVPSLTFASFVGQVELEPSPRLLPKENDRLRSKSLERTRTKILRRAIEYNEGTIQIVPSIATLIRGDLPTEPQRSVNGWHRSHHDERRMRRRIELS